MKKSYHRPAGLLAILGLALAGLIGTTGPQAHAAASPPRTIPALQQWTPGTGTSYTFGPTSHIVVDSTYASQLAASSATLADDVKQLTGVTVAQTTGTAGSVAAGDIFLTLGSTDTGLGAEGYSLSVGTSIKVQAATDAGAFYGTRTVLQLLKQSATVPAGTARDWSSYAERGLMVDAGRKYFSVSWLQNQIKDMAYLKLNYLHLHLSDNLGFRLESATHPEIVSAQHYSKQEITDLIAFAAKYHVTVVSELDMPGHMDTILAAHPELKLRAADGSTPDGGNIDLSNPASYQLMKDLITEYLPLFPSGYWHLGADEYGADYARYPQLAAYAKQQYGASAKPKDVFYGFIRWADAVVRGAGKAMRVWNDGIASGDGTIAVAADITVDYWYTYGLTPQQLVTAGHRVQNGSWTPTYYVLGGAKPDTAYMYEQWNPGIFQGGATLTDPSKNLGSTLHVWCDNPNAETENQIAGGIMDPLRDLAQQTWGSPKPVSTFSAFQAVIAAIGHAPGWPADVAGGDLALNRPTTASSTETADFPAGNATDGSYGRRWSSQYADPQWLQVDLGATTGIGEVKLTWENAYAKAYQIQTSNDGATWTTIYSTTTGTGGVNDLTGLSGSGRYIRMNATQRATTYGYSLWEFEVYGATHPNPNLALGRPATASSTESNIATLGPSSAVDGGNTTRWASNYTDPQWLQVDLGATYSIGEVKLTWENAYAKAYQIQVSNDGATWTTIYSTTTGAGGVDDLTGLSGSGRYVRMYGTQRGTSWGYSLWEFEVHGG
ncbi:discoidin domain-containing protein [Kitasatospora sp. NBC_00240]|uniref:discoidin domain-containing protein n=1 Tax=Kitasatospora sp. NBC_00240 TaxID=2903567 RepID=UPI002256B50B|nr:discoidin domain-containing protein [Kitasatospora sp. NBC_00240]MCX5209416.1 discoidin domain-containing protein [Kitasatospora sp. NBC_00240]